ncbi:MAG: hypothetical protein PUB87_08770 [Eubacteriaceae bacterium]|nr:hypothetical protein [Eubacteriaceae bacterium]
METMKRSKRRLAISLLTIMAMLFTMIPYMGTDVALAETNDLVQTYTPTVSCPVSKVEYVPQSNGTLQLKVTVDLDVLKNAGYSTGNDYFGVSARNKTTNSHISNTEGNISVSGEKVFTYGTTDSQPNYDFTWNQEFSFKFYLYDKNPQLDPEPVNDPKELVCKAPSPFVGFSAEYYEGESDEYVDVKYTGYNWGSDSGYNIFLRENPVAGTIKQLDYTTYRTYRDSIFKPGRTYVYYVVKNSVLSSQMKDFWDRVGSSEMSITAEERAKLRTISAYAEVAVPGPRIINVSNLKVTPGVRSASLTWDYDYETIEPNVSGFYVRIYSSDGNLYKEYNETTENGIKCSAKHAIPYKGTYYFTVTPYFEYEGETYEGTPTAKVGCTSKSLSAATGSVTKISDKKARITIKKAAGSTGTIVYQYTGGKWVKLGSTTGTSYTTTKNTAGKKKYRLMSYIVENKTTYKASKYSSTYSPKANVATFSYSSYPSSYPKYNHYWRPTKVSYSGNKVLVNGKFINTHLFAVDYVKIKITIRCQGKVIGTKTVSSGYMRSNQVKKMSVKLDYSKTGYDLRAGFVDWSYKVISWK